MLNSIHYSRWLFCPLCLCCSVCLHCFLTNLSDWVSEWVSYITTNGQSASLSWCQAPTGLMTRFLLLSDNCGLVDVGRPLWREVGSVLYHVQCTIYWHSACYLALFTHTHTHTYSLSHSLTHTHSHSLALLNSTLLSWRTSLLCLDA
jgi:hypothetical protein